MNTKQRKYIQWLLTPLDERQPQTEEELASMLKCRLSTLRRWFNQPEFQQALDQEIHHRMDLQKGLAYHVLVQKALEGDFRSIKILMEIIGQYPVSPKTAQSSQPGVQPFTIEEYKEALKNVKEWEQQEFGHLDPSDWS